MRAASQRSQAAVWAQCGSPQCCGRRPLTVLPISNAVRLHPVRAAQATLSAAPLHDIRGAWREPLRAKQTVPIVVRRFNSNPRQAMTQTTNRFFDEMARLMNDAAGVASGVRREFDTMFRNQADRVLRDLDVVKREEFEAVKEMARLAREENEALKARIAALEAKLGSGGNP